MRDDDLREFTMDIRMLAAAYGEFLGDDQVKYYWTVLEDEPFEVFEQVCIELTRSEHASGGKMPSAYQLRKAVHAESSGNRYELSCQHQGCRAWIPWPALRDDEGRLFCPRHQPDHGRPATTEERKATLAQLTPEGKAFLRTALPALMADIAVTDTERKAAEEQSTLKRARAFEDKAEGPGVNPGVFLNRPFSADFSSDYAERRKIVASAGWKYHTGEGRWTKGKRHISDDQIDGFSDTALLAEFVGRR